MIGPCDAFQRLQQVGLAFRLGGMQPVPALHFQSVAPQFVVAGDAPDVGGNLILLRQDLLRAQSFVQNRAASEQLHLRRFRFRPPCKR